MTKQNISWNYLKIFSAFSTWWIIFLFIWLTLLVTLPAYYYFKFFYFTIFVLAYYSLVAVVIGGFVFKYFKREKIWRIYEVVLRPYLSIFILLMLYLLGEHFNAVLNIANFSALLALTIILIGLVFLIPFFAFTVACVWLHYLKRKQYPHQIAWIFYLNQINFKWYLLLSLFGIIILFLGNSFGAIVFLYFLSLTLVTSFPLTNKNDIRKYCRAGLITIEEGLSPEKAEYEIFPTVVDQFNVLAERTYPAEPRISNPHSFCKDLFISAICKDKSKLNKTKEGIKLMIDALKVDKPEENIDFYSFIEGIELIRDQNTDTQKNRKRDLRKEKFQKIKNTFEIRSRKPYDIDPRLKPLAKILIAILAATIPIYVTIRIGDPEFGYQLVKNFLGENQENLAKSFFPIGEASFIVPQRYTVLERPAHWSGGDKLNGTSYGEFSFKILNEHRGRIMINDLDFTFTIPITEIHTEDGGPTSLSTENIELEIRAVTIQSPSEPVIIREYDYENITVSLEVKYDLRALRRDLEQFQPERIVIERWVQISISYKILGKNLIEDTSESLGRFNFIFLAESFLQT